MPRTKIDLNCDISFLSILDENGKLDAALEPDIPEEILLKLFRYMLLGRRFDERLLALQRQGRIGTFPPASGQEAAHLGAVALLRPSDWFVPSFREMAAEFWRGRAPEGFILFYGGYGEGAVLGEERNDLTISIPIASQIPHAVGLAWSMKYRGTDDVAMVFFGDGATSEGDFHEALNFAGVYQIPAVFVCQNNQWAISIPREAQTRSETLAQKAIAYGIPGVQVDGNDILAVYAATKEAVDRARAGGGPTLIECVTYRLTMHTTADDPTRYRSDTEVQEWLKRDPLPRFRRYLTEKGTLSEASAETIEAEVMDQIQAAVDRAEEKMKVLGDPLDMFDHAFAKMPAHLAEQKRELAAELRRKAEGEEADHG